MLNPFKMFNRLAWLAMLLFGTGTAAMVAVVVLATDGLGSRDLINLPTIPGQQTQQQTTAPEPEVKLNDVVDKRPVFENVPLPSEISTKPSVVGTNFTLAIILAIIFGVVSTILGNIIREEEETFERWFFAIPIIGPFFRALTWTAGRGVQRGCLTLPIIVIIFALYGIIFSFLEDGLSLFTPQGMQLALVMAMSVGLISLAGDVAQRQVARFWRRTAKFGLYPANLVIASITTLFSRMLSLSPGIVFGVPGGADIDLKDEPRFREVVLALTTLAVIVVFGGLGWGAATLIRDVGDRTMSISQAEFSGPLAQLGLSIGLALFLVAIQTSFFEMVPLTATFGSDIFRWNPLIWFAAFVPVAFAFLHTLLNPNSSYLDAFRHANVQVLSVMIIILTAITALLWIYFHVIRQEEPQPPYPGAPYGAPPPQYPAAPPYRQPAPPQGPPPQPNRPIQQNVPPPAFGPAPQQQPPRPGAVQPPRPNTYVPPPIVISDNVPPPIVISDKPDQPRPDDQGQRKPPSDDEDEDII